jgi:hypothetical protein
MNIVDLKCGLRSAVRTVPDGEGRHVVSLEDVHVSDLAANILAHAAIGQLKELVYALTEGLKRKEGKWK